MTKSSKAYEQFETLEHGGIFLFILKSSVKKTWWVRYKLPNHTGYVQKKSLKTTDFETAKTEARREYTALRYAQHNNLPLKHITLRHAFNTFTNRPARGKPKRYKRYIIAYDRFVEPFFKANTPLGEITDARVREYFDWRIHYWQENATKKALETPHRKAPVLSKETVFVERQLLNSLFLFAFKKGWVPKVPDLNRVLEEYLENPNKIRQGTSRGFLDPADYLFVTKDLLGSCPFLKGNKVGSKLNKYELLRRYLKWNSTRWDETGFVKRQWNGRRLYVWLLTITNTGIRPQTLLKLTWSDIQLRKATTQDGKELAYTYIYIPKEKRKRRYYHQTATHCVSADYYRTWKRLMNLKAFYASIGKPTGPDDLIFPDYTHRKRKQGEGIREGLRSALKKLNIYRDEENRTVSSYSFRSFFITVQARKGTSIRAIADQCNTSISMIEATYYKARPESYLDELVSGRDLTRESDTMKNFMSKHETAFH